MATANPRAALLAPRVAAWAVALPALKRVLPLPRLVNLMAAPSESAADQSRQARVVATVDTVLRVRGGDSNCLERSLLLYRYLGMQGFEPELRIGFRREDPTHVGHAWVTADGQPVAEAEQPELRYTELLAFASNGARRV